VSAIFSPAVLSAVIYKCSDEPMRLLSRLWVFPVEDDADYVVFSRDSLVCMHGYIDLSI